MSKTKIRIHPDARKAMMYFSAEPEKSSPITEADNLLISCINAPFSGSGVTSMIKQHEVRGYNKPVDMQESALQNGLYIFADCSDLRTELHKRAKRAFSHKKPGHGVELINAVSDRLQKSLTGLPRQFSQAYEIFLFTEAPMGHELFGLGAHHGRHTDQCGYCKTSTEFKGMMVNRVDSLKKRGNYDPLGMNTHALLDEYNLACGAEFEAYKDKKLSDFVKLCESLGMMSYCHNILAKHNLDI